MKNSTITKKFGLVIVAFILCLSISIKANAQAPSTYFIGSWNVSVADVPIGDVNLTIKLERKDGKLVGVITDTASKSEVAKIDAVDELEDAIVVYFFASETDVDLYLKRTDQDNVEGSMMNQFPAKGKRVKL
ncbi:hypothetical protein [Albibacterium bauzanense]|uniref:Uncharacterized protein n=1 Tax=Albibacterium bauzanense TaxID=653929 RepID=A0A4R1LW01_9SPHI|nr:hypothetical protein [Albibacterium bauzanense]TCK83598.1 hypothetical protein C8N28_2200 [Albibacterium bauzanense]